MPDTQLDPNEWIEMVHPDKPGTTPIMRQQLPAFETVGWREKPRDEEPVNQKPVIDSGHVQVPAPAVPHTTQEG